MNALTVFERPDPEYSLQKERKRCFAVAYAHGVPLSQALRAGGYELNIVLGASLLREPDVQEVIHEERAFLKTLQGKVDRNSLVAETEQARDLAAADVNPAAMVAATKLKAQLLGLDGSEAAKGGTVINFNRGF